MTGQTEKVEKMRQIFPKASEMIEKVLKEGKLEFINNRKSDEQKVQDYFETWVHVNRNEYCDKEDYHVKISIQHRGNQFLHSKDAEYGEQWDSVYRCYSFECRTYWRYGE